MTNKHFKAYSLPFSDPDRIKEEQIGDDLISEATEVYGDWPQIDTPCEDSPVGQCEYSAREPERCIHCGRKT